MVRYANLSLDAVMNVLENVTELTSYFLPMNKL